MQVIQIIATDPVNRDAQVDMAQAYGARVWLMRTDTRIVEVLPGMSVNASGVFNIARIPEGWRLV